MVSSLEEPLQEEKEEHQDAQEEEENEVPVLEFAVWVQFRNHTGKTYYQNRRTFATSWKPPPDGSDNCWCGFAGFPRAVFLYVVVRPLMLHQGRYEPQGL